jgi:hypothetical protein
VTPAPMIPELRLFTDGQYVRGEPAACWLWRGTITVDGYGYAGGRSVHRLAYRLFVGPIPDGLTVDHVCHNRDLTCPGAWECLHKRCVNPSHLEAVTRAENTRRAHRGGPRPRHTGRWWRHPKFLLAPDTVEVAS